MSKVISCATLEGKSISYVDEIIGSGAMKDVYFSPDRTYVVAFFRKDSSFYAKRSSYEAQRDRLKEITGSKWQGIFGGVGGEYWKNLFCWPSDVVEHKGLLGIVAPTYQSHFFFEFGSKNDDFLGIRGKEKEGKWFASANNQHRYLDPRERGNWLNYIRICILLSRAVRRMHAAGLAHSDLSYKNVLIDPNSGNACIIDIDGVVVPGKFPPDVVGTPDFIAPEVVATTHLPKDSSEKKLPCIDTDKHALAVLIYMYLFYRHPLRGGKVHDTEDEARDELLTMGERALFIEHPFDFSNRVRLDQVKQSELPWADTTQLPFTIAGPYLAPLFTRAFVDSLHSPFNRPSANEWETALVKSFDLLQPCKNPKCLQKWYLFDNTTSPQCPFCGTAHEGSLPILNFYSSRQEGSFLPDNHRLIVWTGQSLYLWHTNKFIAPNEKLSSEQKKRVGYFLFHEGVWLFVNERLTELADVSVSGEHRLIPIGGSIELRESTKILFSKEDGGRLAVVQMACV